MASSIYKGLVPAKNILERDFAINGAVVCSSLYEHSFQLSVLPSSSLPMMDTPLKSWLTGSRHISWVIE